jgi:probable rRNA maturation factor
VESDPASIRLPLNRRTLGKVAAYVLRKEGVQRAVLSVTLLDRRGIARMNRRYLGRRGPTDVIAFSLGRQVRGLPLVGDVYIAPEVVRENARALQIPYREELARVVVHGVLHVLGHDHPEGGERLRSPMWRRQEELLAAVHRWLKR